MKFGVVIFPSKKLQDLVNSYRKRYDSHYALIPPHITLKNAFEATEEDAKQVADHLRKIAGNHYPFSIKTTKISSFQPVNNVIYLKVEPTVELNDLHVEINHELNQEAPEYAFVPHITLGQKLSNDEHSDIYGSLRMKKFDHEEQIDRFHLLYQLENGSWTVYETFRLGRDQ
ncbi:YjcG family protein [Neobacillus niacini]|uniref:YjcG family protein n=1 Tax=Neobacillus niacini TaxID=86668 RepID=UPI002863B84F|nr:YjcG family protein [Neobacillus niacini]MDR7000770.1 2'-5' RNA ligase [Neobacillus niacini]